MIRPSQQDLQELFAFLSKQRRDFRPICRWLLLGPEMARLVRPREEDASAPRLDELLDLRRLVDRRAKQLRPAVAWLAAASEHCDALYKHLQLDILVDLEPESWTHPIQVLPKPRCANRELLTACRQRQRTAAEDEQALLEGIEAKLVRAVQIDERARRRREAQREI